MVRESSGSMRGLAWTTVNKFLFNFIIDMYLYIETSRQKDAAICATKQKIHANVSRVNNKTPAKATKKPDILI